MDWGFFYVFLSGHCCERQLSLFKKKKQEMMIKDFFFFFGDDLGQWTK